MSLKAIREKNKKETDSFINSEIDYSDLSEEFIKEAKQYFKQVIEPRTIEIMKKMHCDEIPNEYAESLERLSEIIKYKENN